MTKKTFFFLMGMIILVAMILAACGGADAPAAPAEEAQAGKPEYQPTGEVLRLTRIDDADPATEGYQPSVGLNFSKFNVDDPNTVTPLSVLMTGETGDLNISFVWDLVTIYQPDLYADFDRACKFNGDITIGGRKAVIQHRGYEGEDACWIEFTFGD